MPLNATWMLMTVPLLSVCFHTCCLSLVRYDSYSMLSLSSTAASVIFIKYNSGHVIPWLKALSFVSGPNERQSPNELVCAHPPRTTSCTLPSAHPASSSLPPQVIYSSVFSNATSLGRSLMTTLSKYPPCLHCILIPSFFPSEHLLPEVLGPLCVYLLIASLSQ